MVNQPDIKKEELLAIDIPTLVIVGSKDMIKQKHTEIIAGYIKYSSLCIIDGDHFIANKNSKVFNESVGQFLLANVNMV